MAQTLVLRGHVIGATTVKVEEPIPTNTTEVEVVIHLRAPATRTSVAKYVRQLSPGEQSKQDVDRQIREERDSWRD